MLTANSFINAYGIMKREMLEKDKLAVIYTLDGVFSSNFAISDSLKTSIKNWNLCYQAGQTTELADELYKLKYEKKDKQYFYVFNSFRDASGIIMTGYVVPATHTRILNFLEVQQRYNFNRVDFKELITI